ncbi:tetratricopeptide repeat protein [Planctomycetales bacterium ZRK34]|nr:tetratricopeptide repeat protein [Planctomycetales bacterium ZRK34]
MPRGICLYEDGDSERAYPLLCKEAASERKPGWATFYKAAIEAERAGDIHILEQVIPLIEQVIDDDVLYHIQGSLCCKMGQRDRGLELMRTAVTRNPNDRNRIVLATHLVEGDEEEQAEAIEILKEVLRDYPRSWVALWHLGYHAEDVDPQKAFEFYARASLIRPRCAALHVELGRVLSLLEEYEDAIAEYEIALELAPGSSGIEAANPLEIFGGLSYCHFQLENDSAARAFAYKALKLDPSDSYAQEMLLELDRVDPAGEV